MTVGPENPIRVERDDTAELFCQVDSKPPVEEVRWVRDIRFVQTQFRHLIPRANLKDEGIYICNADNGLGQVKYIFAILLQYKAGQGKTRQDKTRLYLVLFVVLI